MPSVHTFLCCPLYLLTSIFPSMGSFPVSRHFASGGQSIGASASESVLPMNIQGWFPLGWTGWILQFLAVQGTLKSLLQHCRSKASFLWCSVFFIVQLSRPYMTTGKTIALIRWTFDGKIMSLLFNTLSRLITDFLPRSKHLLISWLQSYLQWFWSTKIKVSHCCHCFLIYIPWSDGTRCHDLSFLNVEF